MNLTINPGAATEDASQIDSIINDISAAMETCKTRRKNCRCNEIF